MKFQLTMASALALALAACGGNAPADNAAVDNAAMEMDANAMNAADANMAAPAPMAANGQDYADKASTGDMFEIESSKLALDKADSSDVKSLAQMIIADHEKATADLKTAAAKATPPVTVAPKLDAAKMAKLDALKGVSGAEFDRLYLSQQLPAHEEALGLVQGYAATGDSEPLKQHASMVSGPIEKHLARIRQLQGAMGQ